MGPILIPYIFPLMLGRTFDLNKMRVGVDIFPKELIENRQVYNFPSSTSYHGIMDSERFKKQLLNVPNPFSTYIKSGNLNASVPGEYLSDIINDVKTLDMASRMQWISSIEHMSDYPDYPKPIPNWKDYGEALGTHYVDQIYYGAEMTASMRFETKTKDHKKNITSAINWHVFELGSQDQDNYMEGILKLVESTQIKVFSSIPMSKIPNDMGSLNKTFRGEFRSKLAQFNKGRGLPLFVKLRPLSELDDNRDLSVEERMFDYYLDADNLDEYFYDLRWTKDIISHWMNSIVKPLTDEQEKKVSDLYNTIENMLKLFYEVLDTLGTPQGPEQLKKAKDAYEKHGYGIYAFRREYYDLRREFDKDYKIGNAVQCSKQCD